MATMSLSILGLYNWCIEMDQDSIFSEFVVPESVDTEVLENNILMQAAPFEICYADPDVLRTGAGKRERIFVLGRVGSRSRDGEREKGRFQFGIHAGRFFGGFFVVAQGVEGQALPVDIIGGLVVVIAHGFGRLRAKGGFCEACFGLFPVP